ncbi:MAG TPA: hypothetical protein VFQ23_01360 [Anaerolineales bacterium]|nr:hypothetical protein [Anaerolineales bacterium]
MIVRVVIPFYSGYYASLLDIFLLCTEPIRYMLLIGSVIVLIKIELTRKRKFLTFAVVTLLFVLGLIPTGHYLTLGALHSLDSANPEQFRNAAREMLDEYEPDTLFSDNPPRNLDQTQVPRDKIPYSIVRANVRDMLVLKDYVFVEKFGLLGLFRGFIVFRVGSDIWKNDKAFTLLEGCSYCWKIRVIEGLYWYHAVPTGEEISTVFHPLK